MNISQRSHSKGVRTVSSRSYRFGKLVLLFLPTLLAFFLPRWIGYDLPNLNQDWELAGQGPPNATAFLGAPVDVRFQLRGAFIGTDDGQVYEVMPRLKLAAEVPEANRQQMLAMRQRRRPLIPFVLIDPPGEIVDYYESTAVYGSFLDTGPSHFVILTDGSIWNWTSSSPSYYLLGFQYLGVVYGALTLLAVFVLLRLARMWPGTWFWSAAVYHKWELVIRVALSAVAALIPGAVIIGLFSLPFIGGLRVALVAMAILTTLISVPSVVFIKNQSVAVLLPVVAATGFLIREDVYYLFTNWSWRFFDWTLLLSLLVVGLLTALAIKLLIAFFSRTVVGSLPGTITE